MVLWNGACMVHEIFSLEKITKLKIRHPEAKFIAHPECEEAVLALADYIGSTTGLLKFTGSSSSQSFIVATESGILHQMQKSNPHKTFIPAPPTNTCACNDCPYMKMNSLETPPASETTTRNFDKDCLLNNLAICILGSEQYK